MTFGRNATYNVNVIIAVADLSPIATTPRSSVTHDGVTFTFDRAMPVGYFVTGKPFVVSDQAFGVTSVSPASAVVNGAQAHGLMKDPYCLSSQGFDQFLAQGAGALGAANTPYAANDNIDPGRTGANVAIAQGEECTLVKAVRRASVTDANQWQTVDKYVPLTILSEAPPLGTFMPTMSGPTKRLYKASDIDLSVFRSITLPGWTDSPAALLADLPADPGNYGALGEGHRRFRLDVTAGHGLTTTNYSGAVASVYAKAALVMHSGTYSDAQKQDLLYRLIEWGIQLEGLYDRGWRGIGGVTQGAGQAGAWQTYYWLAAFVLQSASMLTKVVNTNSGFDQCFWLRADNYLNATPGFKSGNQGIPFLDEQLGEPFCVPDTDMGGQLENRYSAEANYINTIEAAPVALLRNGPGGETGYTARNQGAYNTSNDNAAVWAMTDKTVTFTPWMSQFNGPDGFWRTMWTTVRSIAGHTPWTGRPTGLGQGELNTWYGDNGDFFTATTGGFSWDWSGYNYATETVLEHRFWYSLDGTQRVEVTGKSAVDSQTGLLPGVTHYIGMDRRSASGWSAPVPNYRTMPSPAPDAFNVLATLGSGAAATPAFTTNPVIHRKLKNVWGDNPGNWTPVSGALGADQIQLKCGLGYVSGNANPSFVFQWQRSDNGTTGWTNIPGATSQTYNRQAADAEKFVRCGITPSNSAGTGSTYATAAVECPALPALPAGTLMDTDFRGRFAVDYGAQIAALGVYGGTYNHNPSGFDTRLAGGAENNVGYIETIKSNSYPGFVLPFRQAAAAGATYDVSFEVIARAVADFDSFNGILTIEIDNATGDVSKIWTFNPTQSTGVSYLYTVNDTLTVGAGVTDLNLRIRVEASTSSTGASGGTPALSRLSVVEQ